MIDGLIWLGLGFAFGAGLGQAYGISQLLKHGKLTADPWERGYVAIYGGICLIGIFYIIANVIRATVQAVIILSTR